MSTMTGRVPRINQQSPRLAALHAQVSCITTLLEQRRWSDAAGRIHDLRQEVSLLGFDSAYLRLLIAQCKVAEQQFEAALEEVDRAIDMDPLCVPFAKFRQDLFASAREALTDLESRCQHVDAATLYRFLCEHDAADRACHQAVVQELLPVEPARALAIAQALCVLHPYSEELQELHSSLRAEVAARTASENTGESAPAPPRADA